MTEARYRSLLWIYVALIVAAIASSIFPSYSIALAAAYDKEPDTWLMSSLWIAGGLWGGLVLAWLVGLAGLFFFKGWARTLSLYSTLIGFAVYPFSGPQLYSALETSLYDASTTLWGAILALSYFSAVSDRFGANSSFKPKPLRGSA